MSASNANDAAQFVAVLLALPTRSAQRNFLAANRDRLTEDVGRALRVQAIHDFQGEQLRRSLHIARLLLRMARLTGDELLLARGYITKADALSIGLGKYDQAERNYERGVAILRACGARLFEAATQNARIWTLARLNRLAEAEAVGERAAALFEEAGAWPQLADHLSNLGAIRGRLGDDAGALALFERAIGLYAQCEDGPEVAHEAAYAYMNRAIVERNLGHFDAAIRDCEEAEQRFEAAGEAIGAADARQTQAVTWLQLGQFHRGWQMLMSAREVFAANSRFEHVGRLDLYLADHLLRLRRHAEALERCAQAQLMFRAAGSSQDRAEAKLMAADAMVGLHLSAEARAQLEGARRDFESAGSTYWTALVDLRLAELAHRAGDLGQARSITLASLDRLTGFDAPLPHAHARLLLARCAMAEGDMLEAKRELLAVRRLVRMGADPTVRFETERLSAELRLKQGAPEAALRHLTLAVNLVERQLGQMMAEYRMHYLEDKESVFEQAVRCALDSGRPGMALDFAERARSQVLRELVAGRVQLRVPARSPADRQQVRALNALVAERDRRLRRYQTTNVALEGNPDDQPADPQSLLEDLRRAEDAVTSAWHALLEKDADYALRDFNPPRRPSVTWPQPPAGTAVIEYYVAGSELVIFVLIGERLEVVRRPWEAAALRKLLDQLAFNFRALQSAPNAAVGPLYTNAVAILRRLNTMLLEPIADLLGEVQKVAIVPFGPMHYVPFHALHDGASFLIERVVVHTLPALNLAQRSRTPSAKGGVLAIGHSQGGQIPRSVDEAHAVADVWGTTALVEADATWRRVLREARRSRILHVASHGEFHPDNPLFSGLALADRSLYTLDVFNGLRLPGSLVVLSACQTAAHVLAGGDELLGLARAFLHAGASALVLSLWKVDDASTQTLMTRFHRRLAEGEDTASALCDAQRWLLSADNADAAYQHPFYWAPFILIGDPGPLMEESDARQELVV